MMGVGGQGLGCPLLAGMGAGSGCPPPVTGLGGNRIWVPSGVRAKVEQHQRVGGG